jgi:hypothetical protein
MSGLIRIYEMMFTEDFVGIATDALKSQERVYLVYGSRKCRSVYQQTRIAHAGFCQDEKMAEGVK